MRHLKGVVIPGNIDSPLDDSLGYLANFMEFIRNIYKNYPNLKIIGVCFGHQIITRALGGTVIKLPLDVPIAIGKHEISITKAFRELEGFRE